ncbi:MAG: hypothetical protein MHM6MM_009120, partial [Cercozoa sp. M6MM]
MWHVYNLVSVGDEVTATTFRKVRRVGATGTVQTDKKKLKLTVRVDNVDFDAEGCRLRIGGSVSRENKFVAVGQHHTLELAPERAFSIHKNEWDALHRERVRDSVDVSRRADLAVLVMERGLAHLALLTSHMTQVRAKIDMNIPRKRVGSASRHDKATERFFAAVLEAVLRHVNLDIVKCLVIASPGFVKDDFWTFCKHRMAGATDDKALLELRKQQRKVLLTHSSSGHKHAIRQVLSDEAVAAQVSDTKVAAEVEALQSFFETMNREPSRAWYGAKDVRYAASLQAIDTLLLSDALFRAADVPTRKSYIALVNNVREAGGTVHIFSAMHVSGERTLSI